MISHSTSTLCANNIRLLSAAMVEKANSGHPGGPLGGADFIHVLYSEYLNFDPQDSQWFSRDRFYLDAGHMSAMLYAQLTLLGKYTLEDIKNFRQWKSPTPGHPELDLKRGVENTSGPLGLGHAFGIGSALAERFLHARFGKRVEHKTYIYISDGGIQEEISQGAGRIAGHLGLGNIIMFYDSNDIQLSTDTHAVTSEDVAKKYEAWNWHVLTIDGHDHDAIRQALKKANEEKNKPSLIIGKTIIGKGVVNKDNKPYEGKVDLHGKPIGGTEASFEHTVKNLGGNPTEPFAIFPEVKTYYDEVIQKKKEQANKRKEQDKLWEKENLEQAKKLENFIQKKLPDIAWENIQPKPNSATRDASASVLTTLAEKVENMIVASADLCNSDKTDGFLKKTKAFTKGNFEGAFLQAGVSELTMAALCVGMALHGGVIPACGTFFAFSDYMKPAVRVCALMEQQVIFIWTHDAFRVGEDGPTHQPIEQEAQIRLMEQLKNHSGENSFLALRPADSIETIASWKLALETKNKPSGLILSRQNITDLPKQANFKDTFSSVSKGAYIIGNKKPNAQVLLVANGSEVSTLVEASIMLEQKHNIHAQVISVPSIGLFLRQDKNYKQDILPTATLKFGLTAGLPSTLRELVGDNGKIHGLDHFGYSAPYKVLDEKFGFTPQAVCDAVLSFFK